MEVVFDVAGIDYPRSHFFMRILKSDSIGRKLIGKKVGQVVEYNYSDLVANLSEGDKKTIEESLNKVTTGVVDNGYAAQSVKLFDGTKIRYRISILDFIPLKTVRSLALEK
jgi:hypothetical protein